MTKDITVLRNFSHVLSGSFVRGEHRRLDADLADMLIEANLVSVCEHEHEGDQKKLTSTSIELTNKLIEVPDNQENIPDIVVDKVKTRKSRKKVNSNA